MAYAPFANLRRVPSGRLLGRTSSGTGAAEALTAEQVLAMLGISSPLGGSTGNVANAILTASGTGGSTLQASSLLVEGTKLGFGNSTALGYVSSGLLRVEDGSGNRRDLEMRHLRATGTTNVRSIIFTSDMFPDYAFGAVGLDAGSNMTFTSSTSSVAFVDSSGKIAFLSSGFNVWADNQQPRQWLFNESPYHAISQNYSPFERYLVATKRYHISQAVAAAVIPTASHTLDLGDGQTTPARHVRTFGGSLIEELKANGDWSTIGLVKTGVFTVSALPSAASYAHYRAAVSDSSVAAAGNYGAVVAGGGSHKVSVFSNGADWVIG